MQRKEKIEPSFRKFLSDMLKSFYIGKGQEGLSARKLTAFALMICVAYLHYQFADVKNSATFLFYDLVAILIALSIVSIEKIIELTSAIKGTKSERHRD